MASKPISLADWIEHKRALGNRSFMSAALNGMEVAGERARALLVQKTNEARKVDRGAFRLGWKSAVDRTDKSLAIWNVAPHAAVVEYGRRRGKKGPPPAVLQRWVRRKLGIKKPKQVRAVAFLIGRKIRLKGIPGVHILGRANREIRALITAEAGRAIMRAVAGKNPDGI